MEVAVATNQTGRWLRFAVWALAIAGVVLIALAFGGIPAMRAIGLPVESNASIGATVLSLVTDGILFLVIALGLTLKGRPAWLIGCGAALLCVGTGPLLAVGLTAKLGLIADHNPNPIFFGMLGSATFIPALILLIWGIVALVVRTMRRPA